MNQLGCSQMAGRHLGLQRLCILWDTTSHIRVMVLKSFHSHMSGETTGPAADWPSLCPHPGLCHCILCSRCVLARQECNLFLL